MSSPPCNVIYRGKGYNFTPPVPPYNPYLKRNKTSWAMVILGLVGIVMSMKYKESLGSALLVYGGAFVFLVLFIFGIIWWKRYAAAAQLFMGAPRDCTLYSTDTDVFYARKT